MDNGNKQLVECGRFYSVGTDSYEADFGYLRGQTVLVVGDGMFPLSEEDPYLYRKYFAIAKFENGTMDLDQKPLIVSPDNLEELSEALQESFQGLLSAWEQMQATNEMPN